MCNKNREMLVGEINNILVKNQISLTLVDLYMKKEMDQVIVQASISKVDYDDMIIHFLPQLISIIPENEKTAAIIKALDLIKDEREQMVRGVLAALDDSKKEELLKHFVSAYNDKLCGLINNLLKQNNIIATIEDLEIK